MSSIDVSISAINVAIRAIVIAVSLINLVLGGIGLISNVFVFTRRSLRKQPCSLYFLSSTCFDMFVIFVIVPVRIASEAFNLDLANFNLGICKTESFTFYVARATSCWLIALACVDRYLHSSTRAHIRRISSYKTAKMSIVITIIGIIIVHIHMVGYYEIGNVSDRFGNITPMCNAQNGIYRTFIAFWSLIMYLLCPSLLMLLFGFLTLNNIRQGRQVVPEVLQINQNTRRTDIQLRRMLAAQVLVIVISILPYFAYRLYSLFTASLAKNALRLAVESLTLEITSVLTYFAHSSSFYLYTLTGTLFRREFLKIIRRCCHLNRAVFPATRVEAHEMSIIPLNRQLMASHNHGEQQ
jgi:hypothetical protein